MLDHNNCEQLVRRLDSDLEFNPSITIADTEARAKHVREVRMALAAGRYRLDPERTAAALLDTLSRFTADKDVGPPFAEQSTPAR